MSDFNRDMASVSYGAGRADTAVIDAGLRTYMLRVYNYMTLGLVITGFAALGMYLLSVTGDPAGAAHIVRGGAELPARIAGGVYLTPIGYAVYASPLKWVIMLAPLALVFGLSFGAERLRPSTAQLLFWAYAALVGLSLGALFMVFTHTSIVRVFFITAASFGALSRGGPGSAPARGASHAPRKPLAAGPRGFGDNAFSTLRRPDTVALPRTAYVLLEEPRSTDQRSVCQHAEERVCSAEPESVPQHGLPCTGRLSRARQLSLRTRSRSSAGYAAQCVAAS